MTRAGCDPCCNTEEVTRNNETFKWAVIQQLCDINTNTAGGGGGGGNVNLTQVGGAAFALGQQLAAASLPVVLTAAQISTLTPLSTVAVTQSTSPWVNNITQIGGAAISLGQQLAAASLPVVLTAAQIATLTPLATVAVTQSTSPWVVNLSQVGGVSFSQGQQLAAASLPVVLTAAQLTSLTTATTPPFNGTITETTPTVATATSVTLLPLNASRKYLLIQNNTLANIMISLAGNVLTGIVPTSTNKGIVILPGGFYENPPHFCPGTAITAYQTSGSSVNTISVEEG